MSERWSRDQVLGLAPDAASAKAAGSVAKPAKWGASSRARSDVRTVAAAEGIATRTMATTMVVKPTAPTPIRNSTPQTNRPRTTQTHVLTLPATGAPRQLPGFIHARRVVAGGTQ